MTTTPPRERWQFLGREKWRYLGRETHRGYQYDVYELVANPRLGFAKGRICAVKAP